MTSPSCAINAVSWEAFEAMVSLNLLGGVAYQLAWVGWIQQLTACRRGTTRPYRAVLNTLLNYCILLCSYC